MPTTTPMPSENSRKVFIKNSLVRDWDDEIIFPKETTKKLGEKLSFYTEFS